MSQEHEPSTVGSSDTPVRPNADSTPAPSEKPPRGPKLRFILAGCAAFLVVFWLGSALGGPIGAGWHKLWSAFGSKASAPEGAAGYYTCGMHPWVILPRPGDCPICQMKLVPLDPAKFTGEVTINPVVAQNIGVRVSPVGRGPVVRTIRTVGTVAFDETRVRDVNIKVNGWIEKLYVDYLGSPVKKGQSLFELYSPELYVAGEEYLAALKNHNRKSETYRGSGAPADTVDLLGAARKKLEYLDITPQQIEELEKRGEAAKTMTIQSPYEGVVIAKQAVEGMKVNAGMQVYRIADLSKVWVMVTLYEYQLPYVELGQNATMSLAYLPGQQFQGKVIYIYPYLDSKTRQVDVRLEFENPSGLLKPGMYANIDLHSQLAADRVLVARSAIIDTGERKVAFVSQGEGRFDPRPVRTGAEAQDGMIEVLDGLKPGENVVTSGQFLIDSEANVREALAKMIKGDLASDQKPTVTSAGTSELKALPEDTASLLQNLLNGYLTIQSKLAADSTEDIAKPAQSIAQQVDELLKTAIPDAPHFWHSHMETATVRGKALELAKAKALDQARLDFADLSIALSKLLRATGIPPGFAQEVQELHCPMYREGQGGTIWLQTAGSVRNPYFGSVMLECFDQRKALPVTGQPQATAPNPAAPVPAPAEAPSKGPGAAIPAEQQKQVDAFAGLYLKAHGLLVQDQFKGVPDLLKGLHASATGLAASTNPALAAAAKKAAQASASDPRNLDEARVSYKELSLAAIELFKLLPPGADVAPTLYQVHCPMAKADWVQTSDEVANPYYGNDMLTCGKVVGKIGNAQTK